MKGENTIYIKYKRKKQNCCFSYKSKNGVLLGNWY